MIFVLKATFFIFVRKQTRSWLFPFLLSLIKVLGELKTAAVESSRQERLFPQLSHGAKKFSTSFYKDNREKFTIRNKLQYVAFIFGACLQLWSRWFNKLIRRYEDNRRKWESDVILLWYTNIIISSFIDMAIQSCTYERLIIKQNIGCAPGIIIF